MIRRYLPAAFVAASLLSPILPGFAQTKPQIIVPAEKPSQAAALVNQLLKEGKIIRAGSVKRGMMGYALSVFQGTKIEKFPIVVLGNLERVQGGADIVLIKVLGGPVVKRQSGIIAGMSGSPVYINGKMLGAIALGWGFPKEPIGGVTPITQMIESSLPDPARAAPNKTAAPVLKQASNIYQPSTPITLAGHKIARMEISRDAKRLALRGPESGATMTMRPVNTLLQISGFSEKSLSRMRQVFEPYQISPMIGPASKKTVKAPPIEPGSAMGVQLVSGDMDQTAVGTITFRYGNRILGFGHPMFGQGASSLPLTSAYVHEIFPSYQRSFKLASPIATAGAIQQDTQFAVGGTLGAKAEMIPMSVKVVEAARSINRTFNVQIMKDPMLTPQLIMMVASEAIETKLGLTSDKMVRITLHMDVEGAPPIVRSNYLYANDVVSSAALIDLTQSLMLTQMNEFGRGSIKRVDLSVDVTPGRQTAIIKSMTANKNKVKAGETVSVSVVLEPTATPNKPVTRVFEFKVPDDAPAGVLRLAASASVNFWPLQVRVGGAPPEPSNLRELTAAWNKVGSFNELMVQASTPRQYLQIEDQKVSNPAPTWARLMKGARSTSVGSYNETEVKRQSTPFMLDGAQFLSIPVESLNDDVQATPATSDGDAATTPPKTPDTDGENDTLPLPNIDGNEADGDESTQFASAPKNGRWGALNPDKSWDEQFAAPALLKSTIRLADKEVPKRDEGERPVGGTGANPAPTPTPTPTPGVLPTPTPTPTPAPPVISGVKSVGRPAQSWIQTGAQEFLKGKFDGAFVNSAGEIRTAPGVKQIAQTSEPFVWSIAGDDKGNVYLGTGLSGGNKARILKVDASGKQSVFWEGDGVAVTALATDDKGNIYAGVAPKGKIVGVAPNGKACSLTPIAGTGFVWSLDWDSKNNLLVGMGGEEGSIRRIHNPSESIDNLINLPLAQRESNFIYDLPVVSVLQKHVRAVSTRGDDIFFGTGADGVLYRYNERTKKLDALWQAGDAKTTATSEVLAVVAAPEGVYFGTSLNGTIYRWTEKDGVETVYASPQKSIFALERGEDGTIYAATGDAGIVYQIQPGANGSDARVARLLKPDQRQALALATVGSTLLVGTGNGGAAYRVNINNDAGGTYTSAIFDAKSNVRWGTLRFLGKGANIETRSGNTSSPDASWSAWQAAKSNDLGELSVASPEARYLQYRVRVSGNGGSDGSTPNADVPAVSRIEVVYRAPNVAPEIDLIAPKGGEYWNGKKQITWSSKDANSDALQYRVSIRKEGANPWTSIGDPNLTTPSFSWDTKTSSDGVYQVRIVAEDNVANPEDPKSDEETSLPFIVDNTAPVVEATLVKEGETWRLTGSALDATSPITGAEWRFIPRKKEGAPSTPASATPPAAAPTTTPATPATSAVVPAVAVLPLASAAITPVPTATPDKPKDGNWQAIAAADGIFDSRREALTALVSATLLPTTPVKTDSLTTAVAAATTATTVATVPGKAEDFQFEVRAFDAAGNSFVLTLELP